MTSITSTQPLNSERLVLVEDMGVDAGLAEFLQMLARQAIVRSQKDDPVREKVGIPRLEVVQILQDVHMQ